MKNLFEFATVAPNIPVSGLEPEKENKNECIKEPFQMVKLVYESTQPIKDTQKETGRQFSLSDSDQDVKNFMNSFKTSCKKIVEDSEEEDLDIQTSPAKICGNEKCKTGLSIEWKSWENGLLLCFGCWEYYSKFGSFSNYKKEVKPISSKNFNFLKSPRKLVPQSPPKQAKYYSSPLKSNHFSPVNQSSVSGRRRRQVSAKRNYRESSSEDSDIDSKRKIPKSSKKVKQNFEHTTDLSETNRNKMDKTTSISVMEESENNQQELIRNALVWAFCKENGLFDTQAIIGSVETDSVNVLFFQGSLGHELPLGNYKLGKDKVKFLDLEPHHQVFIDQKGEKVELIVTEALSDGALFLAPRNNQDNVIVGTKHGVYMDEKVLASNLDASLIKKKQGMYKQIFQGVYIIFSLSSNGKEECVNDVYEEMEEIKKSFIFRGGKIFGIGDNITDHCKYVLCVSNVPNKGKVFLSCLARKIPIISISWIQLCVKHETLVDPLTYKISSGVSELIKETNFPVSRYIYQNLEGVRVFENKEYKLNGTEIFMEKWKFILECGGAKIVCSDHAITLGDESETWLEQCLVHQYHFGYFKDGSQYDSDIFNVDNKIN